MTITKKTSFAVLPTLTSTFWLGDRTSTPRENLASLRFSFWIFLSLNLASWFLISLFNLARISLLFSAEQSSWACVHSSVLDKEDFRRENSIITTTKLFLPRHLGNDKFLPRIQNPRARKLNVKSFTINLSILIKKKKKKRINFTVFENKVEKTYIARFARVDETFLVVFQQCVRSMRIKEAAA